MSPFPAPTAHVAALAASEIFLALNGYDLIGVDDEAIADLMEAVAGDRADERAVRAFLAPHVEVIGDDPDFTVEDDGESASRARGRVLANRDA